MICNLYLMPITLQVQGQTISVAINRDTHRRRFWRDVTIAWFGKNYTQELHSWASLMPNKIHRATKNRDNEASSFHYVNIRGRYGTLLLAGCDTILRRLRLLALWALLVLLLRRFVVCLSCCYPLTCLIRCLRHERLITLVAAVIRVGNKRSLDIFNLFTFRACFDSHGRI